MSIIQKSAVGTVASCPDKYSILSDARCFVPFFPEYSHFAWEISSRWQRLTLALCCLKQLLCAISALVLLYDRWIWSLKLEEFSALALLWDEEASRHSSLLNWCHLTAPCYYCTSVCYVVWDMWETDTSWVEEINGVVSAWQGRLGKGRKWNSWWVFSFVFSLVQKRPLFSEMNEVICSCNSTDRAMRPHTPRIHTHLSTHMEPELLPLAPLTHFSHIYSYFLLALSLCLSSIAN